MFSAIRYGHVTAVTSARPGARTMRVWVLRAEGWRLFAVIGTALTTGTTPFAAAGGATAGDCDNPCRSMPYTPTSENAKTIAGIFQQLKMDEWHPNPENWAPYVLDDVYYVTATAQLSKADRVARLAKAKETGAPSVPGDPVVSMRIVDLGDSAVMTARHNPYRGGKPYYSVRVWALQGRPVAARQYSADRHCRCSRGSRDALVRRFSIRRRAEASASAESSRLPSAEASLRGHAHAEACALRRNANRSRVPQTFIRSSLMRLPPRICSFCALLRNDAFTTKSTPTGQSKG